MPQKHKNPPQGARRHANGCVTWRIWAPLSTEVSLVTSAPDGQNIFTMQPECEDYFVFNKMYADAGLSYAYRLADGHEYPDPASLWQPDGVHKYSRLFFPQDYTWRDLHWHGISRRNLVIYELHVGAFTPEGTLQAITPRLAELRALGITAIELMPVAQFAGDRNWGYDAVYLYAVQNSYGGPRELQRLVDAAHQSGIAVFLDVIYNHLGPEGNYLANFGPYFTDSYQTLWGSAVNYDGAGSDAVRRFVIDNALMWIRDFHIDGLRLDAVHAIYDRSPRHILLELQEAVQREAKRLNRIVHVIAESNQNDVRLIRSRDSGGYDLDGVWNDDFHHSIHALLSNEHDGYYLDFGTPAQIAKTFNKVFVYDGCYSPFFHRRQGSRVGGLDRMRFVNYMQNHDQIGNRARGDRLGAIVSPAAQRLACALLMLSPCVPLLFMGEEYGETNPFPFFSSFEDEEIIEAVRSGRRQEFADLDFRWEEEIPDPQDPQTFKTAKLNWSWPPGSSHAQLRKLYQDLLAARRVWSPLRERRRSKARLCKTTAKKKEPALLELFRGGKKGLLAVANLSNQKHSIATIKLRDRKRLLSTEESCYGGNRTADDSWTQILPYELLIFGYIGECS